MGTVLFLPPRPLGPPPLPPAVRWRLSNAGLVVGLPEAVLSGVWLLTPGEAISLRSRQALLSAQLYFSKEKKAGWDSVSFPPEHGPLEGELVSPRKLSFQSHLLHLLSSLRPE